MKAKNNTRTEKVAVGEWVADVRTKYDSPSSRIKRKVLTNGVRSVEIGESIPSIVSDLRAGYEVRFTSVGEDVIRLFPCLDADFRTMSVVAQTMGSFRYSLNDIAFKIVRKDGKELNDIRRDRRQMKADRKENPRISVTPDTMVTCPECGAKFRVGKQLV